MVYGAIRGALGELRDPNTFFIEPPDRELEPVSPRIVTGHRRRPRTRIGHRGELDRLSKEIGRSNESLRVTLFRLRESLRRCIRSYLFAEGGLT